VPIWQSPAIFLQQAISACVMVAFGKQAKAGIAVHAKTRTNTNVERNFPMNRCYRPHRPRARTQVRETVVMPTGYRSCKQRFHSQPGPGPSW
jgi:hypothetical protein